MVNLSQYHTVNQPPFRSKRKITRNKNQDNLRSIRFHEYTPIIRFEFSQHIVNPFPWNLCMGIKRTFTESGWTPKH